MPIDPELEPLLQLFEEMGMPDPEQATPALMRELMAAMPVENPTAVAAVEDRSVPGPGGDIPLRIYRPDAGGPWPVLVFFHGGGWVVGNLDTHDEMARQLCVGSGALVISVDYRLAPEAKFPAAAEDCYAATAWAAAHAAELGADGDRLAVAGDSAGGNLAAVVPMLARERDGPGIRHQLLIYPVTDYNLDTASYLENADGAILSRGMMRWFWNHYLAEPAQAENPLASPLRGVLAGLPPATVITAGYDPLRDEGIAYAEALQAAGVEVEHRLYPGMVHGFVSLPGDMTQTRAAMSYLCERARAALAE